MSATCPSRGVEHPAITSARCSLLLGYVAARRRVAQGGRTRLPPLLGPEDLAGANIRFTTTSPASGVQTRARPAPQRRLLDLSAGCQMVVQSTISSSTFWQKGRRRHSRRFASPFAPYPSAVTAPDSDENAPLKRPCVPSLFREPNPHDRDSGLGAGAGLHFLAARARSTWSCSSAILPSTRYKSLWWGPVARPWTYVGWLWATRAGTPGSYRCWRTS